MAWKCFDEKRRIQLEALYRAGHTKKEMAALLGCHLSTIYRELRRGSCLQRDTYYRYYTTYSSSLADSISKRNRSNCGVSDKFHSSPDLVAWLEHKIIYEHYSPAACAAALRSSDLQYVCKDTIYRYIHRKYFDKLRPSHLPEKGKRKHPLHNKPKEKKAPRYGTSIELRPSYISDRSTFGHWEMDCVIGKQKGVDQTLLVLTERLTRFELIFKLHRKDSSSVVSVINNLQRRCSFRKLFKSITMDNGVEFSAAYDLEHYPSGRKRTSCYYCHPYTSCERGSNENANRLIRRWLPKGSSFSSVDSSQCVSIARWMNTYPRIILGWKTASQAFIEACEADNIPISDYFSQFLS